MNGVIGSVLVLTVATGALGQTSASYRLDESAFNAGGHPAGGAIVSSPSFRVSLDAIGDAVARVGLASASFRLDGGFASRYPPPLEVHDLQFNDKTTLVWDVEPSIGSYGLYRGTVVSLAGLAYGSCVESEIASETTTDPATPVPGACFFYLVTATNRLGEEGTKGYDSFNVEHANPAPCP